MDKVEKFRSDIKRRARKNDASADEMIAMLSRAYPNMKALCQSLGDFWKEKYVASNGAISEEAEEKLVALAEFLDGQNPADALDSDDWRNIKDEVNFAAEDLDIASLEAMMSIIVENGGLD